MHLLFLGLFSLISIAFIIVPLWLEGFSSDACVDVNSRIAICATSSMSKLPNHGRVPLDHINYSIKKKAIHIDAARNETVAFQLVVQNKSDDSSGTINFKVSDFVSNNEKLDSKKFVRFYQAWYHYVDHGGYTWGPKSKVLPWPDYYPDALIPQFSECSNTQSPLFSDIKVPDKKGGLQSTWLDIFVPKNQPEGLYKARVKVSLDSGESTEIPIELNIWPATLPDKPNFDAVGEIYRAYRLEGAGNNPSSAAWRKMSHCYQKMAHKHRMVFMERTPLIDAGESWTVYDKLFDPMLSGSLFSAGNNYIGPGENTPVGVWRTPWLQAYDVELKDPITEQQLKQYTGLAKEWSQHAKEKGWRNTDFFAYIFDEVDGPTKEPELTIKRRNYLAMAHEQMKNVQDALDAGSGDKSIDLLWTSHSNPFQWYGIEQLDLSNTIRLWAPNAHAASPVFMSLKKRQGSKIWFYHSGHPAVGIHSINASGVEMRTWGVIGARYQFDGQLMWAVNLGLDEKPFSRPSYKAEDDRFGNGVMVYPGNQLEIIGFPSSPGPIPSMRLKAWRQGLQDAELAILASGNGAQLEVDQILHEMVPEALAEAEGNSSQWSSDPARWIEFHRQLLSLASQ